MNTLWRQVKVFGGGLLILLAVYVLTVMAFLMGA